MHPSKPSAHSLLLLHTAQLLWAVVGILMEVEIT